MIASMLPTLAAIILIPGLVSVGIMRIGTALSNTSKGSK